MPPLRASSSSSIRLVKDRLRSLTVIESIELAVIECHRAEEVPRHAPGGRRPKHPAEGAIAEGEEQEEKDGIVVRKAIPELPPSAVLIEQIHDGRPERAQRQDAVEPSLFFR